MVVSIKEPPKVLILLAFAALYIIWGSTYLSIMIALESIPPFLMVGSRFLTAGLLLFGWCLSQGEKVPSMKTFGVVGLGGILMLFMGNGAVTWAEQFVPSGLAAIVVASVPLWFVLLDKRNWKANFGSRSVVIGILVGFAGVLLLFAGKNSLGISGSRMQVISFFVLILGTIGWAIGSLYSKYKTVPTSTSMKAAMQMLAAGFIAFVMAFLRKEPQSFKLEALTWQSLTALLYLIIMGSLVAFMSYIWLLSVRPASVVGTYAYVNPVVAVFLGWIFLNEEITWQQSGALAVIILGVVLVNSSNINKRVQQLRRSK